MAKESGYDSGGSLEIVIQMRDKDGNPTGKTRTFQTNSSEKLSGWFEQNTFRKMKKKVVKQEQISGEKAEEILADLYKVDTEEN